MKVIIINGSPRVNGLTASVLHSVEKKLNEGGVQTEFYDLVRMNMAHCMGCCSCYKTGSCCIHDDAEMLSELIREADGLVIGSPTYASNVSGLMKVLIDRGHFVIEQLLLDKKCVTVATGENYGNKDALKVLDNLVLYSGGQLCDHVALKAPFNDVEGAGERVEKVSSRAAKRMLSSFRAGRKPLAQRVYHFVVFRFGIKPFVLKKGDKYQGVVDRWKEAGAVKLT